MDERFVRSAMLLGKENIERLRTVKVAVFGIGGVGSFVCEALARCGVGNFVLVDNDTVDITNINRQLIALKSTLGKSKVDVMEDRIKDIYEFAAVTKYKCFYLSDTADEIDLAGCDYIVDAVDTVSAKIEIVMRAEKLGIPVISSMGMGSRLNPSKIEVADIKKTHTCPLARFRATVCWLIRVATFTSTLRSKVLPRPFRPEMSKMYPHLRIRIPTGLHPARKD